LASLGSPLALVSDGGGGAVVVVATTVGIVADGVVVVDLMPLPS
jgi:hypothetical protein